MNAGKFCKDCKWYGSSFLDRLLDFGTGSCSCYHPHKGSRTDPVTGRVDTSPYCRPAFEERNEGYGAGRCGPDGRFFQARRERAA